MNIEHNPCRGFGLLMSHPELEKYIVYLQFGPKTESHFSASVLVPIFLKPTLAQVPCILGPFGLNSRTVVM